MRYRSGYIAAFITIFIWSTTFISTKLLLNYFQPIEILFYRFVIGIIALVIICPKGLKETTKEQEILFALAGLCGITLYYLLENIALTYTSASHVSIIISIAPFFTAIISYFLSKRTEKLSLFYFIGFLIAIVGICMVSLHDSQFDINPIGDILALLASLIWALYSVLIKKISNFGFNTIQTTKRIFIYGVIFMFPMLLFFNFQWNNIYFLNINNVFHLLFLGLGASALCFVTWNFAIQQLGVVKTSTYIYMVPVITVITSSFILQEEITISIIVGTVLTLIGLLLSHVNFKKGGKKSEYGE